MLSDARLLHHIPRPSMSSPSAPHTCALPHDDTPDQHASPCSLNTESPSTAPASHPHPSSTTIGACAPACTPLSANSKAAGWHGSRSSIWRRGRRGQRRCGARRAAAARAERAARSPRWTQRPPAGSTSAAAPASAVDAHSALPWAADSYCMSAGWRRWRSGRCTRHTRAAAGRRTTSSRPHRRNRSFLWGA